MPGWIWVAAGGAVGSVLRYVAVTAVSERWPARFPSGTFAVNIAGSFAMGVIATVLAERYPDHAHLRLLLATGFLGGFTTFSAFEWETWVAVRGADYAIAAAYVAASLLAGFAALAAGVMLVRR